MEDLCFGVLAKTVQEYTTLNQQETVALLLAPVTEKVRIDDQILNPYEVTSKEASLLANRRKNLIRNFVAASKRSDIVNSLESFVDERIRPEINPSLTEALIKKLVVLVKKDPSIPTNLRSDILNHASVDQFSYFFSKILLYSYQTKNTASESSAKSSLVIPEELNDQYCKRLFEKLSSLFSENSKSLQDLCDVLQQQYDIIVDVDTIEGFFSGEIICSFPLILLWESSKLLDVSMDGLFADASNDSKSYFKNMVKKLYLALVDYQEAFRKANQHKYDTACRTIDSVMSELFYFAERQKLSNREISVSAMEIVDQYNKYGFYFNKYANSKDRTSSEALNNASKAEKEFLSLFRMVKGILEPEDDQED